MVAHFGDSIDSFTIFIPEAYFIFMRDINIYDASNLRRRCLNFSPTATATVRTKQFRDCVKFLKYFQIQSPYVIFDKVSNSSAYVTI